MKKITFTFILFIAFISLRAQNGIQAVKGIIIDQQSEMPLIGATIQLVSATETIGTTSDIDGNFRLEGVPIGRQAFQISYLGYETVTIPNINVTAGKEVILDVQLQESLVKLNEVVVVASANKDKAQNELATISARQFSMEEVNRFSGGRSDVGRLAGNFAGVATADDSRNDIVIRGNSPTGVLWRLEGIPIPSPNHFSTIGTTGGPVSALNPNLLKNSDFITSAFPSEYGDALSGVFDIGLRNGNKDRHEFTAQVAAVTGFELMAEGPMAKTNGGSYLVAGRYSFVGIAQAAGLDIGTNAVPNYYDLSFKFNLGKSRLGNFTLFGIGGQSDIDFLKDEVDETDLFAADDEDSRADSRFGVLGLRNNYIVNKKTYVRTVAAISTTGTKFTRDRYYNLDLDTEFTAPFVIADDALTKYSISSFVNTKFNARLTMRAGALLELTNVDITNETAEFGIDADNDGIFDLINQYDFDGNSTLIQPFVQTQYKINRAVTLNLGLHGQYQTLNEDFALEPRFALNWQVAPKHTVNFGYGLHHQSQPLPIQLSTETDAQGNVIETNKDLGFSRSNHFVIGYDYKIASSWRSKLEVYYQYLDQIPVDPFSSSFSMLNVGADFGFPRGKNFLVNEGTGFNTGVELTIEKFFNQGYYGLFTASIFDSKYEGSDGIERNTAFNNQYVFNLLFGKEWPIGKEGRHRLTFDTKVTTAGGRFFTPVDLEASRVQEIEIRREDEAFSQQYASYFRWDVKFGMQFNSLKRKISQGFYFDIQNVTDNENIFRSTYNRQTNEVNDVFQIGFFPNFLYKIEF
ncbi:MAG: carboxypeptidase-like regulatory domain-containing protein [Bacteroidota bacterium]